MVLFHLPAQMSSFSDLDVDSVRNYLQAAGGADGMTIEIREDKGPSVRHLVLGRGASSGETTAETTLRWKGQENSLFENEVFNSIQAWSVFDRYFARPMLPDGLTHRPI
jgi:hypothetical protein